mgnify:CR=1 FL=1
MHQFSKWSLGEPGQQRLGELHKTGPSVDAVHIGLAHQFLEEKIWQRSRFGCQVPKRIAAFAAYQRIRVISIGQEKKTDLPAAAQFGQGGFQSPPGGSPAGAVTIKAENNRRREAKQSFKMS